MESQSAFSKGVRGSTYNMAVSGLTIVLGFVRTVLLMRLLAPDQFGVVALALFFMTFLRPFSEIGIDFALIQKQEVRQETFSAHFVLRLALALVILGMGFLASPLLRHLYADQVVVVDVLLVLLVLNVLVASFSTPGIILRREMRFGSMALLNLGSSLAMTITAPLLAYLGAGLWSLVAEQAIGPVIRWIGLWGFIRPWQLSLRFDWGEVRSLLSFGKQILLSRILGITLDRFDDFWTGTALGATALGYYSRSYEIAQYPERVLATPITSVFLSVYAATQDDKEALSRAFFRSSSFLVRVGFLMAIVLMVGTPEITVILFDETWLPIVPVFRLMLVYVVLSPLYSNLSNLIVGIGRPTLLARVRLVQVGIFVITVIVFANFWGISGVALAANLMMLTGTAVLVIYSQHFASFSISRMFLWPVLAASVSLATSIVFLQIIQSSTIWHSLILKTVLASGIYVLILYFAERRTIDEIIDLYRTRSVLRGREIIQFLRQGR
jgi:PST family polysaccharide transporter